MTIQISPDQATHAVAATRPDPEAIDRAWNDERAEQVLHQLLSAPEAGAPTRPRNGRRWALIGAAAALAIALGFLAQSIVPVGTPGAPAKANALERLAEVASGTPIPANGYAKAIMEAQYLDSSGTLTKVSTTRWVASDGWTWTATISTAAPHRTYQKSPEFTTRDAAVAALMPQKLPSDPAVLKQQMVERYAKLMAHSNRSAEEVHAKQARSMLAAIYGDLADPRTVHADRVVLLRTLGLVDGITVIENTVDPGNRPALAARVTYHRGFDDTDLICSICFDPASGDPLALEERTPEGKLSDLQLITERSIVTALPERIVKVLGTKRVVKNVGQAG